MDLTNATLMGLATIGVVNVVIIFKPELDSRMKFAVALITAFAISFIPVELGNILLDKLKMAIEVAFATSGAYKLVTKAGGK